MRAILLLSLLGMGCTYSVHDVHFSGFSPGVSLTMGRPVEAKADQFVFLGITAETNYVDEAQRNLMAMCPRGSLQGITSRLSTSHGFLSWTNKLVLSARCIETAAR